MKYSPFIHPTRMIGYRCMDVVVDQCQFVKVNAERCKRHVAAGQKLCWQHAHGLRARWRSLTGNQAIGFLIGVAGIFLTCGFGVQGLLTAPPVTTIFHSVNNQTTIKTEQQMVAPAPTPKAQGSKNGPFLVTIGGALEAVDENHAVLLSITHLPATTKVKGIHSLLHISVINNQPSSTMISKIEVEETVDHKQWQKLILIPTIGHQIVWPYLNQNKQQVGTVVEGPFFEQEINQHVMHPGDLVHGWLTLNFPGPFEYSKARAFRVTIQDAAGKMGEAESMPTPSKLDNIQDWSLELNGLVDLSFLPSQLFSPQLQLMGQ